MTNAYQRPQLKTFDDATIRNLKKPPRRISIPHPTVPRFYLVVQPTGKKSWKIQYEWDGKPDSWTIGSYPIITLKKAREMALQGFEDVANGINPKLRKRDRTKEPGYNLVQNVIARWVVAITNGTAVNEKLSPTTIDNYLGVVNMFFCGLDQPEGSKRRRGQPGFRDRTIQSITKAELAKARDTTYLKSRPQARKLMKALRGIFMQAVTEGLIEIERNPAHWTELGKKDKIRSRLLKPSELQLILEAAQTLNPIWRGITEMLLLTGKRRSEVQQSPRREWKFTEGKWVIPIERVKGPEGESREDHVPITDRMRAIITSIPRMAEPEPDDKVFGTQGQVAAKRKLDKAIVAILAKRRGLTVTKEMTLQTFGFEPWRWHDLRRAANVNWKKALGLDRDLCEEMLNHAKGADTLAYDPDKSVPQKRDGYLQWEARIELIRAGLIPDVETQFADLDWNIVNDDGAGDDRDEDDEAA